MGTRGDDTLDGIMGDEAHQIAAAMMPETLRVRDENHREVEVDRARAVARAESGMGDGDGNALGYRPVNDGRAPSAGEPGFAAALETAVGDIGEEMGPGEPGQYLI